MKLREPGEHGIGIQVREGDQFVIPAGWMKLSMNFDATATSEKSPIFIVEGDSERSAWEALVASWGSPRPANVPVTCKWLMCLAVEPEFQEDRLADFEERFNDLWVPNFGRRGAVAVYVWHVLRQSRLIDWLIRAFGWSDHL
jgi:hypothetical protein